MKEKSKSKTQRLCCASVLSELRFLDEVCEDCEYRILAYVEDLELSIASDIYYEGKYGTL